MNQRELRLSEISQTLKLEYIGNDYLINGLNLCNKNSIHDSLISYLTSYKYVKFLRQNSDIKTIFLSQELYNQIKTDFTNLSFFVVDNPEETFYDLHTYLYEQTNFYDKFDFKIKLGSNCKIHETAHIENGVTIGSNVIIGQNSIIKRGSCIGDDTYIGCGSIIGSEGFQLIQSQSGKTRLIRHAGGCTLANSVYIGDNSIVCNSLFENTTYIGKNTKVDNLVHIAHNCIIGENCVLTAGVILSGSTIIENNVWIAPNSSISNKVILEDDSFIGIGSVVLKKVKKGSVVFGNPAKEI